MNKKLQRNKCVLYLSLDSIETVNREHALDNQRIKCTKFCEEIGYEIADIFADIAVARLERRIGLQHMVGYLNEYKDINTIVCTEPARLTGECFEYILLSSLFKDMGLSVRCINSGKKASVLDMLSSVYKNIRNSDNLLIKGLLNELMEDSR